MALDRGLKSVRKNSNPDVPAPAAAAQTALQLHKQRTGTTNLVSFILAVLGIIVYVLSDFL
jgi:hypothetical protein